jgi:adenylate cyclase
VAKAALPCPEASANLGSRAYSAAEGALVSDPSIPSKEAPPAPSAQRQTFDDALGRRIIDLHVWAVGAGLRGTDAEALFDGFCQRLVAVGVPLWRAFAGTPTLHPQWSGYSYTWRRDLNAIHPASWDRMSELATAWRGSPFARLLSEPPDTTPGSQDMRSMRRRLVGPEAVLDFPVLAEFAAAGATDYFAIIIGFRNGDPSYGSGVGYSFMTQRPEGLTEDDLTLLKAVLPAVSLAMMSNAAHTIAANLLAAYLGGDAGRRVHAGAIERGSVESIHAVLWYADLRGFTAIADGSDGAAVIELLDDVFETLAAALRPRGGEVLKFLGDGMLAIFPVTAAAAAATCRAALDAAAEATLALDILNEQRGRAGKPGAAVDIALHLGEVLYGNIGAADRLDFTVIGPAVNEVARMEALCQPLGRKVLVSAELAAAAEAAARLEPLGRHALRGVRAERELFALVLDRPPLPLAGEGG